MIKLMWLVPAVAGMLAACENQNGAGGKGSAPSESTTIRGEGRSVAQENSAPEANAPEETASPPDTDDTPLLNINPAPKSRSFKGVIIPRPFAEPDPILL